MITTILGLVSPLIDSSVARHLGIIVAIWWLFVIIWELILELIRYKSQSGEFQKLVVILFEFFIYSMIVLFIHINFDKTIV